MITMDVILSFYSGFLLYLQEEEMLYNSEKDVIRKQEEIEQTRAERMFKHKHMEEHLDHLNVTKKWE